MSLIIGCAIIYGLGWFALGFGLRNLWRFWSDRPQHPSGRCLGCLRPIEDCDNPITHAVRR
jgi:hypothetical protein